MLYKNKKGIVHDLNPESPQVKKWIKDEQVTKLDKDEAKAYALKLRPVKKAVKAEVKPDKTATEIAAEEYLNLTGKLVDPEWKCATIKAKNVALKEEAAAKLV